MFKVFTIIILMYFGTQLSANETTKIGEVKVVTSASGYEQKITDAPASISVITQEDLQKKSYTNLLDAVADIEGVDIGESTDKSGQGTISLRGMGSDYTLVLIDGKKQNNNGNIYPNNFGGLQFANIPPLSMIERIEVIRGPMSTLYGADAMGGVINIIMKKISKEWVGSISHSKTLQTEKGFGNKDTTDIAIMGPLIDNKLGLSLRGSYYDNAQTSPNWARSSLDGVGDTSKKNNSFGANGKTMDNQNWTFGTGLTFTPNDNHTIKADFDIAKQKYDNSDGFVGTVDSYESIYKNQRVGYAPMQRMQREQYSLFWDTNWKVGKSIVGIHHISSKNLGRSLPLSLEQREYINANKSSWPNLNVAMNDPFFAHLMPRPNRTLESKNTTFTTKYELPLKNNYIVVGTEVLKASMKDGVFGMEKGQSNGSKEYYQYSFFAEDNWNIIDPLTLTVGTRYTKHEDFGNHISPRAYLIYTINDNWTTKGGIATGYKTPEADELQEGVTGFGRQGTSPWFGNANLEPEKSVNYEMAAYYEHPDKHNFNITLFHNDFKNKIELEESAGAIANRWKALGYTPKTYINARKATIKGFEASGKLYFLDNLSFKGNWTYMNSQMKTNNPNTNKRPLTKSPKHMYSATLDLKATSKFNTYLQYQGEIDRFNTRYVKAGQQKDLYYKDYSVWNLGATLQVDKNLTFNTRVNNLFDKDFKEYSTVDKIGNTTYYYDYSHISAGRNFWFSANYTF